MPDKIILAIRKIAGTTLIPDNVRNAYFGGVVTGLLRMPKNVPQLQWTNTRGTPKRTDQALIEPGVINQHTYEQDKNNTGKYTTRAYAAGRMLQQQDWSRVGYAATPEQARIIGELMGRARIKNYNQGGSRNVKPGGYGALDKNQLDAARAWFGYDANMSDELVQKRVLQLLRLLARTKPQPSAYGRGITNYGNSTMPA